MLLSNVKVIVTGVGRVLGRRDEIRVTSDEGILSSPL